METQTKKDLKINGDGSASGGVYEGIKINGSGRITGDVDCEYFKCNGDAKVIGSLTAQSAKINGSASITGSLKADEFKVMGFTKVSENVESKDTKVSGQAELEKNISSDSITVNGELKIKNDCNAEVFTVNGAFTIGGMLNAGEVEIKLYGPCRAKEIGCEKIEVRKGNAFKIHNIITSIFPSFDSKTSLITDSIEGDEIYLENTRAKIVRGNNVEIGPGCDIELVEYKTTYKKSDGAAVKEEKKV
ncbi:MAG: hypothetical protein EHM58_17105 [Ignavibacteriae bacterium]|nr:MAG: hypothetical protein EHM58_17105 [Ignavibacteriota bacterium]